MKHAILYPLVSVLAMGISGAGTYLIRNISSQNHKPTEKPEISTPMDSEQPFEEPGFSKMINKLMSTQEIISDKLTLTVSAPAIEDICLTVSKLDLDIGGAISGDMSSLKLKGDLNVRYSAIDENLKFYWQDNTIFLKYEGKYFSFNAPNTIAGVMPILDTIGIDVPSIGNSSSSGSGGSSSDSSSIMNDAMSMLENVVETKTVIGYDYTLDLSSLVGSLGLPINVSGCQVVLSADSEYNLIGIKTKDDGILIDSSYTVKVETSGLLTNNSSQYQALSESEKGRYTEMSTTTSNICTTIADLMNKKNFKADCNVSLKTKDNSIPEQKLHASIQADLSTIKTDVSKGTYEVNVEHKNASGQLLNSVYGLYHESNVYLKVNNLIKGKLSNKTIEDLLSIMSKETPSVDIDGITTEINSIISGTDFKALLAGDLSHYKDFISDFTMLNNGVEVVINANFFGLGDYLITLGVYDTYGDGSSLGVTIKNLQFTNYILDVSLDVKAQDQVKLAYSDKQLAEFKDYQGVMPIFNTISSLINSPRFNSTYTFDVTPSGSDSKTISARGEINADMNSFALNGETPYYGDYKVTVDTKLNGYNHHVEADYLNHDLYLTLDSIFKQKISDTEIGAIISVIQDNTDIDSTAFDSMNETITYLQSNDFIDHLLGKVKDTYSLSSLEEIISIDKDNLDPTKLIVELNLPYIFENTVLANKISGMSLEIDTDAESITGINVSGLSFKGNTVDFTLNLENTFTDFALSDDEKSLYTEVNNLSKVVKGFFDLPTQLKQFSINLDGAVYGDDATSATGEKELMGLTADAQVDITDKTQMKIAGQIDLNQPADDKYAYNTDHQVLFQFDGGNNDGQTIAQYRAIDENMQYDATDSTSGMHLLMKNSDIFSIYDKVMEFENHKTNAMYKYLGGFFDTAHNVATGMPLLDAFKNKDYSLLLNDYIKKVEFTDKKIYLELASSILDGSDTTGRKDIITVEFDDNYQLKSVQINGYYSTYHLNATISLGAYDSTFKPSMLEYNDETKASFVDVHGFDLLLDCMITTTDHHFFDLAGTFNLDIALGAWNITGLDTYITAYVDITDQGVNAYLGLNNNERSNDNTSAAKKGFYGTEYFIQENVAYTTLTRNDKGGINNAYVEIRKISQAEILKNIVYYLLSYSLNIESMSFGNMIIATIVKSINESSSSDSSVSISRNFSSLIDSAIATENEDGSGSFALIANLSKLLTVPMISFKEPLNVNVGYDSEAELTTLDLSTKVLAAGIATIKVNLSVTRTNTVSLSDPNAATIENQIRVEKMTRFTQFVSRYEGDSRTKDMESYVINSITHKTVLGIPSGLNVKDNGEVCKIRYSEDDKIFFFGQTL